MTSTFKAKLKRVGIPFNEIDWIDAEYPAHYVERQFRVLLERMTDVTMTPLTNPSNYLRYLLKRDTSVAEEALER